MSMVSAVSAVSTVSTVLGGNGLDELRKGAYMELSGFGALHISVTPHADNPKIMSVDIGAENRKESVQMTTNMNETVDQFTTRIKSMLRSLWNMEPRVVENTASAAPKKEQGKTWNEDRARLENKGAAAAAAAANTTGATGTTGGMGAGNKTVK